MKTATPEPVGYEWRVAYTLVAGTIPNGHGVGAQLLLTADVPLVVPDELLETAPWHQPWTFADSETGRVIGVPITLN